AGALSAAARARLLQRLELRRDRGGARREPHARRRARLPREASAQASARWQPGDAAMTCPNALTLSLHADGALPADEAAAVARHLEGCSRCAAAVAAFELEAAELRQVLQTADLEVPIPRLPRP